MLLRLKCLANHLGIGSEALTKERLRSIVKCNKWSALIFETRFSNLAQSNYFPGIDLNQFVGVIKSA